MNLVAELEDGDSEAYRFSKVLSLAMILVS